jgi:hypothetical protein
VEKKKSQNKSSFSYSLSHTNQPAQDDKPFGFMVGSLSLFFSFLPPHRFSFLFSYINIREKRFETLTHTHTHTKNIIFFSFFSGSIPDDFMLTD